MSQQSLPEFTSNGYVRIRHAMNPELCGALRREGLLLLAEVSNPWLAPRYAYSALWHQLRRWVFNGVRAPTARHIVDTPLTDNVRKAIAAIALVAPTVGLRPDARLVELNFTISLPTAPAQAIHSDISPMAEGKRVVTFWTALQETTAEMGPTEIWSGSHIAARSFMRSVTESLYKPFEDEIYNSEGEIQVLSENGCVKSGIDMANERKQSVDAARALLDVITQRPKELMTMQRGDIVAMDCSVFHRGGANSSDKPRVLLNVSFEQDDNLAVKAWTPSAFFSFFGIASLLDCCRAWHLPGFTYHCLPDILVARYALSDFQSLA